MVTDLPKLEATGIKESVIRWLLETRYPGVMPDEMDEGERAGRAAGTRCALL
jgi:hypothetical protein